MEVVRVGSAEELEHTLSENFAPCQYIGPRPVFRRGQIAAQDLGGGIALLDANLAPVETSSEIRFRLDETPEDVLIFGNILVGACVSSQYGRDAEVSAGGALLTAGRSAGRLELDVHAGFRTLALVVSRELMPDRPAVVQAYCTRPLRGDSPAMRVLSGYLHSLRQDADGFSAEQRRDAGDAAFALMMLALRDLGDRSGENNPYVLLERMRQYVRGHSADSRLTVAELARRHHVSVRQAHAAFAPIGITPGSFIREQRLKAARAMLADPKYHARPLPGIAAAAGFSEVRSFHRAFRREYGIAPGEWRERHLRLPLAPGTSQARIA